MHVHVMVNVFAKLWGRVIKLVSMFLFYAGVWKYLPVSHRENQSIGEMIYNFKFALYKVVPGVNNKKKVRGRE